MDLYAVKNQLEDMVSDLRQQLAVKETDSVHALSAYDNHPADLGTDTFERELDVGLERGLAHHLAEVERALEKIDEDSYGICDRCHHPIDAQRLQARPESVYCLPCQQELEQGYVPVSHHVIPMPFGDRPDIHHGDVETDGEDIWQSVAQWGTSNSPQDTPPAVDYHETYVGFDEPVSFVEQVESVVDEQGEPLLDAAREKLKRQARSTDKESDEYPF
ncbi:TraR/DksA C4-type zinc finger protein [Sulfobacillus thermosulfidooxidans]|uniref:TraR/DksA C4-type zinc finger protein n=1 Tax=Sulfobacillus thermosulfidooxidans TaxID=28034 RepID=UPI0003FE9C9E|nr:TraR/DksA C4-type zinc finger protein [Sulfobacillus thermosulfidooxidans]